MKKTKKITLVTSVIILAATILYSCAKPIREFYTFDKYIGPSLTNEPKLDYNPTLPVVVIVADNNGTEIFDLLAPFYLLRETYSANVYILAQEFQPIVLRKGLFLLPHSTYDQFDLLNVDPDIIVIPNLSAMDKSELNGDIIGWIKKNYQPETRILSVCDGALTAAATGIYDQHPITTHASDLDFLRKQFAEPEWVRGKSYTKSLNLYSTAGVSNAVEGSLKVIKDFFGEEAQLELINHINYPQQIITDEHKGEAITFGQKLKILKKSMFSSKEQIGVILHEGISEFNLAATLDVYYRSFPHEIKSFSSKNMAVTTKHGLRIYPTGNIAQIENYELYALEDSLGFYDQSVKVLKPKQRYIFDYLLDEIGEKHGEAYVPVVKALLDYD
ncbi:DJ-1/PfpI family protein [Fulvivirga lutea]|uniref:DJ-1/PfpI family protein n=1 Tax=Fulvivirga lutea TaxID=2810512 RepID=A0A974WNE1_9BACT|nr:DJ-1/PfpI family protein [Fulvivirga lutea]QSE98673.1 DJ-1/PfpI family protein [Fulvivirga lutea]